MDRRANFRQERRDRPGRRGGSGNPEGVLGLEKEPVCSVGGGAEEDKGPPVVVFFPFRRGRFLPRLSPVRGYPENRLADAAFVPGLVVDCNPAGSELSRPWPLLTFRGDG